MQIRVQLLLWLSHDHLPGEGGLNLKSVMMVSQILIIEKIIKSYSRIENMLLVSAFL